MSSDHHAATLALREALSRRLLTHLAQHVFAPGELERTLDRIASGELLADAAADALVSRAHVFDHIGIAVADSGPMRELFAHLFGMSTDDPEVVGLHRLRFVSTGGTTLELIEPVTDEAPVAKFIAKKGAGLHHICFRVTDIDKSMDELRAKGVQFIDAAARPGAHGSRIAFIHPQSACGLLIEIKQPAGADH